MNPRHFSQHRAKNHTGSDDPLHLEPTDLSTVQPKDYLKHEGAPVMLTPEILEFVMMSRGSTAQREVCDHIETRLEAHYKLAGTGWGITWDARDQAARLVQV